MLANALRQTGWEGPTPTPKRWPTEVEKRLENLEWDRIVRDVKPFLEDLSDAALLSAENVRLLLQKARRRG